MLFTIAIVSTQIYEKMRLVITVFLLLYLLVGCGTVDKPIYLDDNAPVEERVEDALSRLTLDEKTDLIHAQSKFSSKGVPRLGIPENWLSDGPLGVRPENLWDKWGSAGWTNDA